MMPACTGLPPGELMRSTTACAPASSNALFSAGDQRSRRSPRCRRRSRRAPRSARCAGRSASAAWSRCDDSPRRRSDDSSEPDQAEEDAPAALAAAVLQIVARELLGDGFQPLRRGRRQPAGGATGGSRSEPRLDGLSGSAHAELSVAAACVVERPAGCRGKDTNRPGRRAPRRRARVSRPRPHGPPAQRPVERLVDGAVGRAQDELLPAVEELAGLPVHLGRHVDAAVQVGDDPAVEAQRERARRLARLQHVEDERLALLGELGRRRRGARGGQVGASSGMFEQPVVQVGASLWATWRGRRPPNASWSCAP